MGCCAPARAAAACGTPDDGAPPPPVPVAFPATASPLPVTLTPVEREAKAQWTASRAQPRCEVVSQCASILRLVAEEASGRCGDVSGKGQTRGRGPRWKSSDGYGLELRRSRVLLGANRIIRHVRTVICRRCIFWFVC